MLTARSFLSLKVKRLALFVSLSATAASLLSFGPTPATLACSPPPPVALRELYTDSERVVLARAGQSAVLKTEKLGEENDYQRSLLRTSFYVSRTFKGKGAEEEVVHVYRWLWGENRDVAGDFAEGKRLLLFLRHSEDGEEGYEIYDDRYGAKELSDDALKVYIARMEELEKILRDKKPDKAAIVEWLVRCAEEPATSWEGAYELYTSQENLDRELSADSAEQNEEEEPVAETDESLLTPPAQFDEGLGDNNNTPLPTQNSVKKDEITPYNSTFARLLTPDHKKRLANTLFGLQTLRDEDMLLMQLVANFPDERMVPFILSQLAKVTQDPPYYAEQMLTLLAEELDDEKLTALAEKYAERALYFEPEESQEATEGEEKELDEEEKALTGNSTQKRSARLQKILAEVESLMSNRIALARSEEINQK